MGNLEGDCPLSFYPDLIMYPQAKQAKRRTTPPPARAPQPGPPVFTVFRHRRESEHGEAVRAYLKTTD